MARDLKPDGFRPLHKDLDACVIVAKRIPFLNAHAEARSEKHVSPTVPGVIFEVSGASVSRFVAQRVVVMGLKLKCAIRPRAHEEIPCPHRQAADSRFRHEADVEKRKAVS